MSWSATQKSSFRQKLLKWFHENKRALPFRGSKNPFQIWLSEIMAQQTTMTAVVPYFNRFIARYDSVEKVARAPEEELLKLWQGLGYYSRIRNFKAACEYVVDECGQKIPQKFDELVKLKGVGEYTAAAISSIAFGEKQAVVDGNVKRVLARLFAKKIDPTSKEAKVFYKELANDLLSQKYPGDFNEAMMELGATVCTPKKPVCLVCPVQKHCAVFGKNPQDYPPAKKMKFIDVDFVALMLCSRDGVVLKAPHQKSLIKNMWELPGVYEATQSDLPSDLLQDLPVQVRKKIQKKGVVKHGITNKKISTHVYQAQVSEQELTKLKASDWNDVTWTDLKSIPVNTLTRKIIKKYA